MELLLLILMMAFSSTVGINLDKNALAKLTSDEEAMVQNHMNNFLDSAGLEVANALKEKNNYGVWSGLPNGQQINSGPPFATVPYYHPQQWLMKSSAHCALINWIKWAIKIMRLVYEKGMGLLQIHVPSTL